VGGGVRAYARACAPPAGGGRRAARPEQEITPMPKSRSPFLQSRTDGGVGPLVFSDARFAPNNVFFVNSTSANAGDSSGKGQTPDAPFATIDYAIGQCDADKGDLIVVLPS